LDYQIQRGDNWRHVVSVRVPAEQVRPELDAKYAELKNIRLEGFRKGKVPAHLEKKMYGKQVEADVFRPFISEAYQTIFKENEFDLLDSPELANLHFDEQQGLTFEFHFDVRPVIPTPDYQGLQVDRYIFSVSDEEVAQTLEAMRRQNAMVYNVEGEAQTGHFVIADLQELDVSGVPILGQRLEDRVLELKEGEEITTQLVGIKAGEERRVQLSMEKPVESQLVQTQTPQVQQAFYLVAAKEIKERRLPELDDEFAKDMGEFDNLQALQKAVSDRLHYQAQSESAEHFRRSLEDELIKRNPVQPPPSMVEKYLQAVMEDARKRSKGPVKEEELRAAFTPMAHRNIAWILLREQLIKDQAIVVSEEELEARFVQISASGKQGEARVQELRKDEAALRRLKDAMEEEKVYDLLARSAKINELRQPWSRYQQRHAELENEPSEMKE